MQEFGTDPGTHCADQIEAEDSKMRNTILLLSALSAAAAATASLEGQVVVNGQEVAQQQFAQELGRYGIQLPAPVPDGAYWYDQVAGLWGVQGGPTMGQLPAGLNLGGELQSNASGGGSNVYINGRALHQQEIAYLYQLFGTVIPGRFWMNAQGIGGMEGGPAMFSIAAAIQAKSASGGGSSWIHRGIFGGMGSDGTCTYFISGSTSASSGCG